MMKILMVCVMLPVGFLCLTLCLWTNVAVSQELIQHSLTFAGQWPIHNSKAIALDSQKQLVYLGDGDTINILDSNLALMSSFKATESSHISGLFFSATDNLLYIACGTEGLKIYDLTDTENPLTVNSYLPDFEYINPGFYETVGVFIDDTKAYLSMGIDGIIILDITDQKNPSILSQQRYPGALGYNYVMDINVTGNIAFIADSVSGLHIADVTNPQEPDYKGLSPYPTSDIAVSGSYLYAALQSIGMGILDISEPEKPIAKSLFQAEGIASSVRVDGNFAFISYDSFGIRVLDITNKTEPFHDPSWIYDASGGSSLGLFQDTDFLFCANNQFGLQKIDISDKSDMQLIASHNTPADAIAIDVSGNYIYALDNNIADFPEKEGLRIHLINTDKIGYFFIYKGFCTTPGEANDIKVSGDFAYVADGHQGLQIINISDKTSPEITANNDTSGYSGGIFIDGNFAYLADGDQGISIINVTDKSNPVLTSTLDTNGFAKKVFVSGDYAYIADDDQGLIIINIFDKTHPEITGVYDTPGTARGIYVKDNYAYVADGGKGISIIDISDKTTPTLTGTLDTDGFAENISVTANYIYVADGLNGLSTIDASAPSLPVSINEWSYNSSGITTDVFSGYFTDDEESYAFIADGAAGIIAVKLSIDDGTSEGVSAGSGGGGCFVQTAGH